MADALDPGDANDSAKGDTAPAAATPPDQGSAMELELSQALIELRRLTIFRGPASRTRSPATSLRHSYRSSWHG